MKGFLKSIISNFGYKVKLTKVTGDFGADLILTKNNRTYIVQAKRYKNKVGVKAIQEIVAAKPIYKADSAIVVTNNYYTKSAWELAKANHVYLVDRTKLIEIQKKIKEV